MTSRQAARVERLRDEAKNQRLCIYCYPRRRVRVQLGRGCDECRERNRLVRQEQRERMRAARTQWAQDAAPLFQGNGWQLLQGDSLQLLSAMPRASVDLVFADPPYNLSNGGTTCRGGRRVAVDKGVWDRSRGLDADVAWHRTWLAACQRVLRPSGTLWVSGTQHVIFVIGALLQQLGYHLLNTITWYKPNASPNLGCRTFTHSSEILIWAAPRRIAPLPHTFAYAELKAENGGRQMRDVWSLDDPVWRLPTPGSLERALGRHPTQKPLALLDRIIRAASKPGDHVLDPFNGSGTTGVAAVQLRRQYTGIDLSAEFLVLTRRRLRAAAATASSNC